MPRCPHASRLLLAGAAAGAGLLLASPAGAEPAGLGVEILTGVPVNVATRVTIEQDGQSDLALDPSFRTEPFTPPIHWAVRVTHQLASRGLSVELMHYKLILDNPPPEVQAFSVTHGFNVVTLQRSWPASSLFLRVGVGVVLVHPENVVRGRRLDEDGGIRGSGYHLGGPAALVGLSPRFPIGGPFSLTVELRATVAPVSIPVADGDARFTNVAFQILAGAGIF